MNLCQTDASVNGSDAAPGDNASLKPTETDATFANDQHRECHIYIADPDLPVFYSAITFLSVAYTKKFILEGADVNFVSPWPGKSYSLAPLHVAAVHGRVEMIRLLLQHGADIEVREQHDRTPLFAAVITNGTVAEDEQLMCIKVILDKGANIDATDCQQMTALVHAVYNRKLRVAEYLLGRGADIKACGYAALKMSLNVWSEPMFLLLLSHPEIEASLRNVADNQHGVGACFDGNFFEMLQKTPAEAHLKPAFSLLVAALISCAYKFASPGNMHGSAEFAQLTKQCVALIVRQLPYITDAEQQAAKMKLLIARRLYQKRTLTFVPLCACCESPADLTCAGCYRALYCSHECQKQSWSTHRERCKQDEQKSKLVLSETTNNPEETFVGLM